MLLAILVSYVGLSLLGLFIGSISLLDWFSRWRNLRTRGCQFHRLLMLFMLLPSLLPCRWPLLSLKVVRSAILARSCVVSSSTWACVNTVLAFTKSIRIARRIHYIKETSFACCNERICSLLFLNNFVEVVKVSRRLLCFRPAHFGWAFVPADGAAAVSLLDRGHLI